jgi:lipopolysaccharide transport system ATP-binding protein
MSDTVIKVENLSKKYRIGSAQSGYKTFRETLADAAKAPFSGIAKLLNRQSSIVNRQSEDTIWALKDVSFEIKRGDVDGHHLFI